MSRIPQPRRDDRKPVVLKALCRTQSGMRDEGTISDISPEGCCVRTRRLLFRVGTRVVIRPEGIEGLTGVVRWIEGDRAGVQFDSPVYAPVIDHLAQRHHKGNPVALQAF